MSESVTLLPPPKDIKIGVGAAFIKARGAHAAFRAAPNTNLIANDDSGGGRGGVSRGVAVDGGGGSRLGMTVRVWPG